MQRGSLDQLVSFVAVARERSFTAAAAKLNVSQSALSHTIRELEERLGVRLLTRTTRSVSPTEAGERLLRHIGPRFDEIEAEVAAVRELRQKPAGTIRITATEFAIDTLLIPKLAPMLHAYPDVKVEMIVDYGLTDIVAQQYDAGVRSGEQVAKDMIAVRIGPDIRMAVVGAPAYFKTQPEPKKPQDLISHNCVNLRLPTRGNVYAWEFEKGSRELRVRVEGQLTFNGTAQLLNAALAGCELRLRAGRFCRSRCRQGPSPARTRPTGARLIPAIISSIQAAASPRPLSRSWSTHCATGHPKMERRDEG